MPTPPGYGAGSAQPERDRHGLHRDAGLDVKLQRVAALQHRVEPAQHALGGQQAGQPADVGGRVRMGGAHGGAALGEQNVAVEGGEVDQGTVQRVPLGAGGARPLPPLQVFEGTGAAAGRGRRALAGAASSAAVTSWSAAAKQAPRPVSAAGTDRTALRRSRASASRASRRARPTWPWAAWAAQSAVAGSIPSRRTSTSATASGAGARSGTTRQRERMVTEMSSGWVDGAQSRNTVRAGGSSTALSSALEAASVSR